MFGRDIEDVYKRITEIDSQLKIIGFERHSSKGFIFSDIIYEKKIYDGIDEEDDTYQRLRFTYDRYGTNTWVFKAYEYKIMRPYKEVAEHEITLDSPTLRLASKMLDNLNDTIETR